MGALKKSNMDTVHSLYKRKDKRQVANRRMKMRSKARKQELNFYIEEKYGH